MTPADYLAAARCPPTMPTGDFGLWRIARLSAATAFQLINPGMSDDVAAIISAGIVGHTGDFTILGRHTAEKPFEMTGYGEIVMEDSDRELRRHLPIWMKAKGRVLITGLGLGCVVRGLLQNPAVEEITVVEIDSDIIRAVWPEFRRSEKLLLLQGDALTKEWPPGMNWDYAWHDVWAEQIPEPLLHVELMKRYRDMVDQQGAWGMPRWFRRLAGGDFIRWKEPALYRRGAVPLHRCIIR